MRDRHLGDEKKQQWWDDTNWISTPAVFFLATIFKNVHYWWDAYGNKCAHQTFKLQFELQFFLLSNRTQFHIKDKSQRHHWHFSNRKHRSKLNPCLRPIAQSSPKLAQLTKIHRTAVDETHALVKPWRRSSTHGKMRGVGTRATRHNNLSVQKYKIWMLKNAAFL